MFLAVIIPFFVLAAGAVATPADPKRTPPPPPHHKDDAAKLEDIRPLPDEKDSFETIRRQNKVYVDKTPALIKLLNSGSKLFYFTRPRKFGKTMFLRMVQKYFLGEKELFEGLEIYDRENAASKRQSYVDKKENKWVKQPVVYLDFSRPEFWTSTVKDFRRKLFDELEYEIRSTGVQVGKIDMTELFHLTSKAFNMSVIILIDEYDAPVMNALRSNDTELAKGILAIIQEQLVVIEEGRANGFVAMAIVTGVSRFSVFAEDSGATNVVDLTDNKEFATAIGFTADEVNHKFDSHIKQFVRSNGTTREEIMKQLNKWYQGYKFANKEKSILLNPVSVIKCLKNHKFNNYWCATMPTVQYVVETFVKDKYGIDDFENFRIDRESLFKTYEIGEEGEPPFHCFMLYEGYLTITNYDRKSDVCVLDYPNKEIKEFLSDRVSSYIASENKSISDLPEWSEQLRQAMRDQKIPTMMEVLKRYGFPVLFTDRSHSAIGDWGVTQRLKKIFDVASIKYKEGDSSAGEDETNVTRVVHLQTLQFPINYVLEIECQKGVQEAVLRLISLVQDDSSAFKKAVNDQNEIYLIGMSFTESGQGELEDWVCLPYKNGQVKFDELQAMSRELVDVIKKIHS